MADKGFLIKDELASVGAALVLPKFLQGKSYTKQESCKSTGSCGKVHGAN